MTCLQVEACKQSASHQQSLFPWKLFDMLSAVDGSGLDAVVSWLPHGRAFKVHNSKEFVSNIMPQHFKQTKYKSFQRQLNLWGFKRITSSKHPDKGAYWHPTFLRGKRENCSTLIRQNTKKDIKHDGPCDAPDFTMSEPMPSKLSPTLVKEDSTHVVYPSGNTTPTGFQPDESRSVDIIPDLPEPDEPLSPVLFEGCQFFLLDLKPDDDMIKFSFLPNQISAT